MDKYGLIGYPLGHSFSKNYFNEKFENEGIDAQYINFEIPSIENLTEILDSNPELKGLNVTIPYKEKVISYLDVVSPEANAIGAVNVIKVEHRGEDAVISGCFCFHSVADCTKFSHYREYALSVILSISKNIALIFACADNSVLKLCCLFAEANKFV